MAKRHLAPRKFPQGRPYASFHGTFIALLSGRSSQKQLSSFSCVSVNMIYGLHSPKSEHIEWEIWLQSANLFCIEPFKSQRPDVRLRPATQLTSWWQIHPSPCQAMPIKDSMRWHLVKSVRKLILWVTHVRGWLTLSEFRLWNTTTLYPIDSHCKLWNEAFGANHRTMSH